MSYLPFVVVYGAWIAKLLVVACGALGVAVVWAWRRRRDRTDIAAALTARTAVIGGLTAGRATLRGKLRGKACSLIADDLITPLHERSAELAVEVEGQRVALTGPVMVVRGTATAASWRGVPRGTPEVIRKAARGGAWRLQAVADGDDVIVAGTLAQIAGDAGEYRESQAAWQLSPAAEDAPIELIAARPAVRPRAYHPAALLVHGATVAVAGYLALWTIGSKLVDDAENDHKPKTSMSSFGGLAIACALPHVRHRALDEVAYQLHRDFERSERTTQMYIGATELHEGCDDGARAAIEATRYDQALEIAQRCGSRDAQADALAQLGRYDEAFAKLPEHVGPHDSPNRAAVIAIAAGKWAMAAEAADLMAKRMLEPPIRDEAIAKLLADERHCVALWFRAKAGDAAAKADLAGRATDPILRCRIARALTLPHDERVRALVEISTSDHDKQFSDALLAGDLAWADGAADASRWSPDMFSTINVMVGESDYSRRTWLGGFALAAREPGAADINYAKVEHAVLELVRGHVPAAIAEMTLATAPIAVDGAARVSPFDGVLEALELHTEMAPIPLPFPGASVHPAVEPLRTLRNTGELAADSHTIFECKPELAAASKAASAGDGLPLAHLLGTCHSLWDADIGTVLAIEPHVTSHRAELAEALRQYHEDLGSDIGHLPFRTLVDGSISRDAARLAGDEPEAQRWQRVLDAQLKVLDDRDKVTGLMLWDAL